MRSVLHLKLLKSGVMTKYMWNSIEWMIYKILAVKELNLVPVCATLRIRKEYYFFPIPLLLEPLEERKKSSPCAPARHIFFVGVLFYAVIHHFFDEMFPWPSQRKYLQLLYEERLKGKGWNWMLWNSNSLWGCQQCKGPDSCQLTVMKMLLRLAT